VNADTYSKAVESNAAGGTNFDRMMVGIGEWETAF
jgi:hypothetical protein